MRPSDSDNPPRLKVRPVELNDSQKAMFEWLDRSQIRGIENRQAALVRIMTLSASMVGGGVAFLKEVIGRNLQITFVIFMLVALIASFIGSTPFVSRVQHTAIEESLDTIVSRKDAFMWTSFLFFLTGCVVGLVGLFLS